jgi:polyisoprenoid-binding protein YceI
MKQFKFPILFFVLLTSVTNLIAQDNYALSAQLTTIDGTSNLHGWHQKIEKISGKGEVKQGADKSLSLQALNIVIQVNSIKGSEGSGMDSKAYKALKADKFPEITFALTEPVANIPYGASTYSVAAKGHLTIAGVTRSITMPVKIALSEDKKIIVDGVQQVKMTDYGIDPPTALLGMLKTGDVITINFKTTFSSLN